MDIMELHPDKVSPEPMSGCWLWTAATHRQGYGWVRFNGKVGLAHRVSYVLSCEEITEDQKILHKCDVTACVNPNHLFVGTQEDNIADMKSKNRQRGAKGVANQGVVLTEVQVLEIRKRLEGSPRVNYGALSLKSLAAEYGVTFSAISNIRRRKTWRHI